MAQDPPAGRLLGLLRRLGLALRRAADCQRGSQLGRSQADRRGRRRRAPPQGVAGRRHRHQLGHPWLVQILRLLHGAVRGAAPIRGLGARPGDHAGGAAGRHLLLHLPGDELRHRHLPAQDRAGVAARHGPPDELLPAPRRGPDRARLAPHSPVQEGAGAHPRHGGDGPFADRLGPVQEIDHRLRARHRPGRQRLLRPVRSWQRRSDRRRLRLCGPDLLRFLRL